MTGEVWVPSVSRFVMILSPHPRWFSGYLQEPPDWRTLLPSPILTRDYFVLLHRAPSRLSSTRPWRAPVAILLIADDNADLRRALHQLFEEICDGSTCIEAVDGVDAVEKARLYHPDVVILDFVMPQMDGLQAARLIRDAMPGVPLFLLTNHARQAVSNIAHKSGIRSIYSKTDDLTSLVHEVRALLKPNSQSATA